MTLLAFHGKQAIKTKYLNRVIRHKKADQLIQGYGYFKDGKGCAVGCTIHGDDHSAYETELGIPTVLARLEDRIFEGLPVEEARQWPSAFLRAIKPGADLSNVWNKFAVWLLTDKECGVIKYANSFESRNTIQDVSDLYLELVEGRSVRLDQWQKVRSDTYADTVAYAAEAAAEAAANAADASTYAATYAADAADAAADAATYAATYAARAASASTRQEAYVVQSKKLLQLLAEAK